jgi:chitodextrinase
VNLSWTAATDNVGVASYNVYRSSTPDFTPSAQTKIANTMGTSYADSGLPAGTYYYQITAQDAAGNVGPASAEVPATALADTTPPTTPTNLQATAVAPQQVNLNWTAATDNVGVTRYNIYRDGLQIGTSTTPSYTDSTTVGSTTYSYTVTAQDAAGNVSSASNAATVTTPASVASPTLDKLVTTHQSAPASSISSPALTTTSGNELLVAFITSDGPATGTESFSTVTGGGLTWRFRQRTNVQAGTSEIWTAVATAPLSSVIVKATRSSGSFTGSISVAAFQGASLTTDGAVGSGNARTGAAAASLTTTRAGSWVWGVGNDWDKATARTVGAGQTKVDEYLSSAGDTFWVQRQTNPTPAAGTVVTINDTSPTTDRWNLSLIEIIPAP